MNKPGRPSLSAYAYNAQATREHEAPSKVRASPAERSYKPVALRLPYIIFQIFMLCVVMGAVSYAIIKMPDSDSSGRDVGRETLRSSVVPVSSLSLPATETRPPASRVKRAALATSTATRSRLRTVTTATYVAHISTSVTMPGTTRTLTSTGFSVGTSTDTIVITKTVSPSTFVTSFVTTTRVTMTLPQTSPAPANATVSPSFTEIDSTVTLGTTTTLDGSVTLITSTATKKFSNEFTLTSTETQNPVTYLTLGPVTVTNVYTTDVPITPEPPSTEIVETVVGGETRVIVETQAPETRVIDDPATVVVAYTPPVETSVMTVAGETLPVVLVTAPTPEPQLVSSSMVKTVDGQLTTVAGDMVSAGSFKPIVVSVVSVVGGTTTTSVRTAVTTGADGLLTTVLTTSLFLTGGTTTNVLVTTTPTGTSPLTFTVATSVRESIVTSLSTPQPSSLTTVISGQSTTIVSTPPPRTSTSTGESSTLSSTSVSTPMPTQRPVVVVATEVLNNLDAGQYFLGVFLPLLVCLVLAACLRIIDNQTKLFQPFFALNSPHGASGTESLTLQYAGLMGWLKPLAMGQAIPLISQSVLLLSSLMVPLSAEALGVKLHGNCAPTSPAGCTAALGVSPAPAYALIAVLAVIVSLLVVLALMLRRSQTGLAANPWSIAGIASLTSNPEIRVLEGDEKSMTSAIAARSSRYVLGYYEGPNLEEEYGIVILEEDAALDGGGGGGGGGRLLPAASDRDSDYYNVPAGSGVMPAESGRHANPFLALTAGRRILFTAFLCGIFALVLYYHLTLDKPSDFNQFMDSHSFGVRFLFALTGVVVTFCWLSFFSSVAAIAPFRAMMRHSQPPERSILITRCSNGFFGLYRGVQQREPYTFLVALMACLAEGLPVVLSNIPYNVTQTLESHRICARISLVILGAMIIVLLSSFFLSWPSLPADPRSVAGAMYYVTDSYFLGSLEGISSLDGKGRAQRIKELGRRYYYAEDFIGRSGTARRGGIDSDATAEENLGHIDTAYPPYAVYPATWAYQAQ